LEFSLKRDEKLQSYKIEDFEENVDFIERATKAKIKEFETVNNSIVLKFSKRLN
jgi:hypothetical protein